MKRKTGRVKRTQNVRRVLIFIIIFIIISSFFLLLLFINKKGETVTEISGRLHTKGTKILDGKNREVVLRGINYNELTPVGYKYIRPDITKLPPICTRWLQPPTLLDAKQIKELGFNSVRLVINWHQLENIKPAEDNQGNIHHQWDKNYMQALDKTITDLTENKVAVILDLHQYLWSPAFKLINSEEGFGCAGSGFPQWIYPDIPAAYTNQNARCDFFRNTTMIFPEYSLQEGFIDVWKMLAERYLQNEMVIGADIINEPWSAKNICTASEMNLNSFYMKLGTAIREVNPYLLLIYEESQDNPQNLFALKQPLKLPNSVYSFHLYTTEWEKKGREMTEKFLKRAQKWNVPLFLGEFDGFGYSGNDQPIIPNDPRLTDLSVMMKYMGDEKISWAFWGYSGYQSILVPNTYKPKEELMGILKSGL